MNKQELAEAFNASYKIHNAYHHSAILAGENVQMWPTTRKFSYLGKIYYTLDINYTLDHMLDVLAENGVITIYAEQCINDEHPQHKNTWQEQIECRSAYAQYCNLLYASAANRRRYELTIPRNN